MTTAHDEDIMTLKDQLAALRDRQARAFAAAEYELTAMLQRGELHQEAGGRHVLETIRSAMGTR